MYSATFNTRVTISTDDISGSDVMLFIIILAAVSLVLLAILAALRKKERTANAKKPIERQMARVIEKQQLPAGAIPSRSCVQVVFETETGRRVCLNVKGTNNLLVGDEGKLSWQGSDMIYFGRNNGT